MANNYTFSKIISIFVGREFLFDNKPLNFKNMKKIIVWAIAALLVVALPACGNRNAKKNAIQNENSQTTVIDVDALLADAESYIDQEIEVEAICTHLCSHGATKMFLMGSDESKTIRVEAAKLGSFDQKCTNSIVKIKGTLREERIDEAYLQQWEQNEQAAEHQHGDGESGCSTEKAARGEKANTTADRIADFRARIATREQAEGKAYLSFYFIEALSYGIVEG